MSTAAPPALIQIELLSDTTFGRGEGTAGQVDVEIDHDEFGIPQLNGKTLRGLLRDTWLSMQGHFPSLVPGARRIFGPHGELDETAILRFGDATIDAASRPWIEAAVQRSVSPLTAAAVLEAFTDIRQQTAEDRETGAPERTTLRSMRVLARGHSLFAPLRWLQTPNGDDLQCLALSLLGTRHAGLSRNRGRGHIRLSLDRDSPMTQQLAKGAR